MCVVSTCVFMSVCVCVHIFFTDNCVSQVTVIDGPVTTRQSTVWVRVHVTDQNDNPPAFPEAAYRVSLPERERNKRGDPVYRVFAHDPDLGANSNVTYSIADGNADDKFSIDPRTALVSSRKAATAGTTDVLTVGGSGGKGRGANGEGGYGMGRFRFMMSELACPDLVVFQQCAEST